MICFWFYPNKIDKYFIKPLKMEFYISALQDFKNIHFVGIAVVCILAEVERQLESARARAAADNRKTKLCRPKGRAG